MPILLPVLLLCLLTLSSSASQSHEQGFIAAELSNKGLDFLKDFLIEKAVSALIPLELPEFEKHVEIPILGTAQMLLSNIILVRIRVTSSILRTDDAGIVIQVHGATADFTANWKYSYDAWLLPITVSDQGTGTVQVEGLEVGLTLGVKTLQGSLRVSILNFGCRVTNISIELDGEASSVYQGLVDTFEGSISSAIEDAISKKIKELVVILDSVLQSLPKEARVTDTLAMNVTIIDDPELRESSFCLRINGLLSARDDIMLSPISAHYSFSCNKANKMVKLSLHEDVLKSASLAYFEAGKMHWIFVKESRLSLLNTAYWRFIIPKLYKMYPNHDMNLNISVSSLPIIEVEEQQIKTIIPLDVVIDVLDAEVVVPIVCISMTVTASVSAKISRNVLSGRAKLNDLTVFLKWSKIGHLHMHLIQAVTSTALKAGILPYINLKLRKGFHLPVFHGYELQDARIHCTDSWIVICSDVSLV